MATTTAGYILGGFCSTYRHILGCNVWPSISLQVRNYAARRGTREKARKAKVKKEVKKLGFVERIKKKTAPEEQKKINLNAIIPDDSLKSWPLYNVWIGRYHRWRIYSFKEAIECHRETHEPAMYDKPNSFVNALVELDLTTEKKTKFISKFNQTVSLPYHYDDGKVRTVLAFCKTPEQHAAAVKGGATMVLDRNDVKKIKEGDISVKDYDYIVAHPDVLPDILPIKGLMKKKFPSAKLGNLGLNMESLVKSFLKCIEYTVEPHSLLLKYGTATIPIGTLDMDIQHLEENFSTVINDLHLAKPKRSGAFITRVRLTCPPSPEGFKIDVDQYLRSSQKDVGTVDEEDASEAVIAPV